MEGGGLKVEGGIWTISTLSQSPSPLAKTREGHLSRPGWWYLFCAGLYFNRLDENVILDNYIETIKRSRQTSCTAGNWRRQPTYNEFT